MEPKENPNDILIRWDAKRQLFSVRATYFATVWTETEDMAVHVGLALAPDGRINR